MFFEHLEDYLSNIGWAGIPIAIVTAFVALHWASMNLMTSYDDSEELTVKENYAYLIQRGALVVAMVVGMFPILNHSVEEDGWDAVWAMLLEGLWVFVAVFVGMAVLRMAIPYKRAGSLSTSVVDAGFFIGFGFILNGSLTGSSPSFGTGLASTVVFGALGLLVMVVVFWLHELFTPYNVRAGIRQGKLTSAIEAGGVLAGAGIVVSAGVAGDFTDWSSAFAAFAATVVIVVPVLYITRWVIDRFVLRHQTVRTIQFGNHRAAAILLAALLVIMAFPVEAALRTHL